MSTVHVLPVNDLMGHVEIDDECPCGPDVEAVFRDDGTNGWLIIHHSLDGRERHEDSLGAACAAPLPPHRTEAGYPNCSTCDGGGCLDCTDPA